MTDARNTQSAIEQWAQGRPGAQATQVAIEQWGLSVSAGTRAAATQVAMEMWAPVPISAIELSGNLGSPSHYGRLSYGAKHYSRISAFTPILSGDVTVYPAIPLSGNLAISPTFSADLDVHVSLVNLGGGITPQIALGGALSLDLPLQVLEGGLTPIVSLGASSFVSGPLWAATIPPAPPLWTETEPCPPPAWMLTEPCTPVNWQRSALCNG